MYKFFRETTRVISKLIYKIEFENKEALNRDGAYVLVANHKHNFDPIIISFATNREINYMAKAELFKTKIGKWVFESIKCISVDRNKNDITAIKKALRVLKNGEILGVFPEGTRVEKREDGDVKSGAVLIASKAKVNIIPVAISGNYKLFSKINIKILPEIDVQQRLNENLGDIEGLSQEIMDIIYKEVD